VEALIIEAALNGATPKARQRHVPREPPEIAADALACLDAGAAIIHSHTHEAWEPVHSWESYVEAWRPVQERYPQALFFPTNPGGTMESRHRDRVAHIVKLRQLGLTHMSFVEPGSLTVGSLAEDGSPAREGWMYINTRAEIGAQFDFCRHHGFVPRVVIFEPGFLRTTLAYHAFEPLPASTLITLVFNSGPLIFGLPPTPTSLDAYLQLLENTGLRWMIAVIGDAVGSGLAQLAIAHGGHVRVGLEDYSGIAQPTNQQLVDQVTALADAVGRHVADGGEAARMLGITG
jgi:uncharacterized protein (DUF849 family)